MTDKWQCPDCPQWQPIETAPKPSGVVILYGKTRHAKWDYVCQGHYYKPGKRWVYHEYIGDEFLQPTHWMPLPAPPKRD